MIGVWFLIAVGFIAVIVASVQDIKYREVPNWISFSLIVFALGFRFFYSLFSGESFQDLNFFYYGLIGLGIFVVIGHLFYYSHFFAGGDAKLLIALGTILPFTNSIYVNFKIGMLFLVLFMVVGGIYGLFWSILLSIKHRDVFGYELKKQYYKFHGLIHVFIILGVLLMILSSVINLGLFMMGILIFIFPYILLYAKTVDEACMIKKVETSKLTEGDWLYENVKVGNKVIKQKWEGLSLDEIKLLKKKKFVYIREGIPFVPVFFISFLILVCMYFNGSGLGIF